MARLEGAGIISALKSTYGPTKRFCFRAIELDYCKPRFIYLLWSCDRIAATREYQPTPMYTKLEVVATISMPHFEIARHHNIFSLKNRCHRLRAIPHLFEVV
jgi:hypothetical protein